MAQKNAVYKIVTPGMDAEAAGQILISKKPQKAEKKPSLESDLVSKGWRYLQNDFKHYLNETLKDNSPGKAPKTNIPEEAINDLVDICMEYTEIDQPYDQKLLRSSLTMALAWDPEEEAFSYKAPEAKGSSSLIKESIDKAFFDRESELTGTSDNSKYRYYHRHLFTAEPPEESRKIILQFAYLLKMTSGEARTYLTKWSFSDDIRWDNPWELAAAYEIECHPAREEDRASTFLEAMENRVKCNKTNPNDPENREYLDFIRKKEAQEYDAWVHSYQEHCLRGLRDEFIRHWAWLLLCANRDRTAKRVVPRFTEETLKEALPGNIRRLSEYIRSHVEDTRSPMTPEDVALRQQILCVRKDRHLRLTAAAYVYARVEDFETVSQSNTYVPPDRELGFRSLAPSVQKIENNFRQTKVTETDKTGRRIDKTVSVPNRLTRSDVIKLGVALALTADGISHLLTIGGFYRLYVRDFFEYTLKESLYEVETNHYMDGNRFGVKRFAQLRTDDAIDDVRKELKKEYLLRLEKNYNTLAPENRKLFAQGEPNWVREGIRKEESEESPLSSR